MIAAAALVLHLLPKPQTVAVQNCSFPLKRALRVQRGFDPGALEEIDERWRALGIPVPVAFARRADVRIVRDAALAPQAYQLQTRADGKVTIVARDGDGAFYGAMTLAQLAAARKRRMAPAVREH